jgi:hypothetical protein
MLLNTFKQELERHKDSFEKLDVPAEQIAVDGEVLSMKDEKRWTDLVYGCTHCKMKYESFDNLLKHLRDDVPFRGPKSWIIKCPVCWKNFNRPEYLNHAFEHHPHLKFTCLACPKIFQNCAFLLKHYADHHPYTLDTLQFCVYCGLYFSPAKLREHKKHEHCPQPEKFKRIMVRRQSVVSPKKRGRPRGPNRLENDAQNEPKRPCPLSRKMSESESAEPIFAKKPCPLSKKSSRPSIDSTSSGISSASSGMSSEASVCVTPGLTNKLKIIQLSDQAFAVNPFKILIKPCPFSKKLDLMKEIDLENVNSSDDCPEFPKIGLKILWKRRLSQLRHENENETVPDEK